mgnify:CR=1 FL=1|tara:strand:+ start:2361 stop:3305 length:945 start_codon:yes stop_codon:yes gene_type:complete
MAYGDMEFAGTERSKEWYKENKDLYDIDYDFGGNIETKQFAKDLWGDRYRPDIHNRKLELFNQAYNQLREQESPSRYMRVDETTGEEIVSTWDKSPRLQDAPGYAVNIANTIDHILHGGPTEMTGPIGPDDYDSDRYRPYPLEKNIHTKYISGDMNPNMSYEENVENLPNISSRKTSFPYYSNQYNQDRIIPSHAGSTDVRDIVQLIDSFKAGEELDFMRDEKGMQGARDWDKQKQEFYAGDYAKEREGWHLGKLLGRERPSGFSSVLKDEETGRYYENPDFDKGFGEKYHVLDDIVNEIIFKNVDEDDFFAPR